MRLLIVGLFITIIWMLPEIILAQDNVDRNGFVLGGWAGYGKMNVNTDNNSRSSYGTFTLGFSGGYAITSKIVIGIELNGWTLKAFDTRDPSKGESISNISIFVNYFHIVGLPLFIEGGGGQLSYTNNSSNVTGRDRGSSWFVESGYEVPISKKTIVFPQFRYSQGNFTGGNFKVYELALGMKWYSGKYK
jgi:hypothetical protein